MTRLVLLGGGHAHLQVLRAFALERLEAAGITLVSPFPHIVYSGMVPGMVAGHYALEDGSIALAPLAARSGVAWTLAAAVGLDAAARRLRLDDGRELSYDVLSVDIGSVIDGETIAGASEHALPVRPTERFLELWPARLARPRQHRPSVAVIGGGAAGFELVLALRHRLGAAADVCLVSGIVPALASYPSRVRRLGELALQRGAVSVVERECTRVEADGLIVNGSGRLPCDLSVIATGGAAPPWLAASGLALDERGFIATGPTLQSTSHPEVFAAGDVASRADAPRPRSGVQAVRAGAPLAANLRCFLGGGVLQRYRPQQLSLNLLSCGERRAIAAWGSLAFEGRWAWRWKDRIDRGFVAGFNEASA